MAKFISSDVVEAAQWDPAEPEATRELLASIGSKIKAVALSQSVPVSTLEKENALAASNVNIEIKFGSNTNAVIAAPTDYIVYDDDPSVFKAMRDVVFEATYHLKEDPVDKSALEALLNTTTELLNGATVSEDGSEVPTTEKWYTQDAVNAFYDAIEAAQAVFDDEAATIDDVAGAISDLANAQATFIEAAQDGLFEEEEPTPPEPEDVDKTALVALVESTKELIKNAIISEDGSDVKTTDKWYTQEAVDTLQAVIDKAQEVVDNEEATTEEVTEAVTDLATAQSYFVSSAKDGTLIVVDKTPLIAMIAAANELADNAKVSVDGSDIQPTEKWYTQEDVDTFVIAIETAQGVVNDEDATEEDVAQAVTDLSDAQTAFIETAKDGTFKEEEGPKPVDRTALNAMISAVSELVASATVSEDGSEIWPENKWYTQEAVDTLEKAIADAQEIAEAVSTTEEEVAQAIADLSAAQTTFIESGQPGTKTEVDKTAINALITAATDVLSGATVSEDGSDVKETDKWYTQSAYDTFEEAIRIAQEVANNKDATEDEVTNAVTDLSAAQQTFIDSAQDGTMVEETPVDKTALEALITSTTELVEGVTVSEDGSDIAVGEKWYAQADVDTFKEAIEAAQDVVNNADATAEEVNQAVTDLATAQAAFTASAQDGTKEPAPDKTALTALVSSATTTADSATVSEDGSDVLPDALWYTQEAVDTLKAAIEVAQAVVDNEDATEDEITQAVTDLAAAVQTFSASGQNGTKEVADNSELVAAVEAAEAAMESINISTDGSDVSMNQKWYTQEAVDALKAAIEAAQEVIENTDAREEDIAEAVTTLNEAVQTFKDTAQDGTQAPALGETDEEL